MILKAIVYRKLKNGKYVILAADSEPLVVEEEFAMNISQNGNVLEDCDEAIVSIFKESGFYADTMPDISIPEEPRGIKWNILRYGVGIISIIALLVILGTIPFSGIPFGNQLIFANVPLWMSVTFIVFFSIFTTILHEMMHIFYARTWRKQKGGINVVLKKSVVTVSMTHIWVWSPLGRLAAVSAGIMSDLFILCIISALKLYNDSWIISSAASILWVRILWQFRFHKKTDGQLMLMFLLDNPLIAAKNEVDIDSFGKKDVLIWKVFQIIGIVVDIFIFSFWAIPFAWSICSKFLI